MKYAVVTGGTRGIGRAVSERLLRGGGYTVVAVYANNDAAAEAFLQDNPDCRDRIILMKADLAGAQAACEAGDRIGEICPKIDVLVCGSAATDFSPFEEIVPEKWQKVIDTNLTAVFFLIQRLAHKMTQDQGRILLFGSYVAEVPHARSVSYGVSKAAIEMLAKYLVKSFAPRGITVNCISPGTINTSWHDEKTPEHKRRIEDKIALHRFGDPDEVAQLCMAVIENQYINGAVLKIDGGYSYR